MELDLINTGLKTTAMLSIVIGLLVLVLFLLKRFIFRKEKTRGDLIIRVLSTLHLSPKERVEVIEISGERLVLGVTPGNIKFLTKLSSINDGKRTNNVEAEELETAGLQAQSS